MTATTAERVYATCERCARRFGASRPMPLCASCARAAEGRDVVPRPAVLLVPSCPGGRTGAGWPTHRAKARDAKQQRERALDKQRARQAADLDRRVSR